MFNSIRPVLGSHKGNNIPGQLVRYSYTTTDNYLLILIQGQNSLLLFCKKHRHVFTFSSVFLLENSDSVIYKTSIYCIVNDKKLHIKATWRLSVLLFFCCFLHTV